MKIHTTQNLTSLVRRQNSTNNVTIPNEIRIQTPEEINSEKKMLTSKSMYASSLMFKAKKPDANNVKKFIETITKKVGEMKNEANPEVKRGDKILKSPLFNKILKFVDFETVVSATIAAVACAARGFTILGMSSKNDETNKANNTYAVSHAWASGIIGFLATFIFTVPFKAGADNILKKNFMNLKEEVLKRLHPQLDLKSIVGADGKRVSDKLWKSIDGLAFSKDIKNCDMLPEFRSLSEASIDTFEKILGAKNIDWALFKEKSFNDVVSKDGKKLYDLLDFNKLGLKVSIQQTSKDGKEITTKGQILFKDLNKEYLEDFIKNADEKSFWKDLDINSAFKDGKIQDIKNWKKTNGEQWKIDLDTVYVSSELETANYAPRISGKMRYDEKEGIFKFRTYQRNGENGALGTEISDEMLKADKESAGLLKSLTWAPDLVFRIPIALTTVSLIPWVLKTMFGVEKNKQQQVVNNTAPVVDKTATVAPSFKASAPKKPGMFNKLYELIGDTMGGLYGKPLIESKAMADLSAKLSDIPGGLTQAMQTFGSLLTSGAYMYGTLTNDKLDADKRKTLSINQLLCFIVPTIAAYTVDRAINGFVKKCEYRYSGLQQQAIADALAKGDKKLADELMKSLSDKVKGVRALASLAVFTIIYRYATPVLITPFANKIGNKLNERNKAEKKEIVLNSQENISDKKEIRIGEPVQSKNVA